MSDGIYVAASGAVAQLRTLEVVANNLAHSATPGYKQDEVNFREVLASSSANPASDDLRYVQVGETRVRREQGELQPTGNSLDLALTGNAFLKVQTNDGERLTRNARLTLGPDGVVRNSTGHVVLTDAGKPLSLPRGETVEFATDGQVRTASGIEVARLAVQGVAPETPLRKAGEGLFFPANAAPLDGSAEVLQGFIEGSNANPVRSMVHLVDVERNFAALQQVIQTYNDVERSAVNLARPS
jgi:flagellar basal body rod protein FlgG